MAGHKVMRQIFQDELASKANKTYICKSDIPSRLSYSFSKLAVLFGVENFLPSYQMVEWIIICF